MFLLQAARSTARKSFFEFAGARHLSQALGLPNLSAVISLLHGCLSVDIDVQGLNAEY
jgi:hypothetical protein